MYIGWDIGIKNLAYCNIELVNSKSDSNLTHIKLGNSVFNIKDWDVINLVEEVETNQTIDGQLILSKRPLLTCFCPKIAKGCIQIDKSGKEVPCNKKATYCLEKKYNGEYRGICDTHYKKLEFKSLPTVSDKSTCYYHELNNTSKNSTNNSISGKCKLKAHWLFKDHFFIGLCKKHKKKYIEDNNRKPDDFLEAIKAKKATLINLTNLGLALYSKMDNKQELLNVDTVLLENQPVLINPTMKSVQMLLYSYFIMKGIKEKQISNTKPISNIKCYQASRKTELIKYLPENQQTLINNKINNLKGNYAKNKKAAIMITNYLIDENPLWGDFYKNHKKKDDLADSLLMTLHYLIKKKESNITSLDVDENDNDDNVNDDNDDNDDNDVDEDDKKIEGIITELDNDDDLE